LRLAIDTGGTFTDCVYLVDGELRVLKVFSTPADPSVGILEALALIRAQAATITSLDVRHGTTVGTNAMLERKGARVAFLTTAGFEDTIAIGRQTRARLYDWFAPVPVCLVPRELRFGVLERVSAEGEILRAPTDEELEALVGEVLNSGAESIAISLLFSFANPEIEERVEVALRALNLPISTSHRILPEFREYERASTTVINAYLAPRMHSYLTHLEKRVTEQSVTAQHAASRVDVMQSSGGIIPARLAAQEPVRTVMSGPAGGVTGALQMARWAGFERIIGFDMGGTSTDVFLANTIHGAQRTRESVVGGVPIGVPMLDIHTVGAGGGSIARWDAGGMLRVGPESAGADPGPICFGRGTKPTVTDANLILGRLDAQSFLGGGVQLDLEKTRQILDQERGALATVEEYAAGILRVVETNMEKAIRVISVERGYDPREFVLVAFGGGGPLHACSLAKALRIDTVLIPAMPGALSAVGILLADAVRDYSRTVMLPGEAIESLAITFAEMEEQGQAEFLSESLEREVHRSVDLRYRGQGHELNVQYDELSPSVAIEAFHQLHLQRYGFCDPQRPTEIVNLRLRVVVPAPAYSPQETELIRGDGREALYDKRIVFFEGGPMHAKLYNRDALTPGSILHGPAMITEYTSATVLPPGCYAQVDGYRNLVITVPQEAGA
jgi:N-methylhydantoinase A